MIPRPLARVRRSAPLPALLAIVAVIAACATAGNGRGAAGGAVQPPPRPAVGAAERVAAIADAYVDAYFDHFPEDATLDGVAGADHGRLTDNSPAGVAAWRALEDGWFAELRAIDPAALEDGSALATYELLHERLLASSGRRACRGELWAVSPTYTGWQARFAFLARVQPVGADTLRAAAVRRFGGELPRYLEVELANLREGIRLGITAPRGNVERVVEQMDALLATPPDSSPFFDPARRDSDPNFRREMMDAVEEGLEPAIHRYRRFLVEEYLPAARREVAVAANPDGAACYRASVRYHTSLDITPEEIHRTGLSQMERIEEEMRAIAERSFGTADVRAVLERLRTDPAYTFPSREGLIMYAQAAVDRARTAVPEWFGLVPEADIVIQPYPPFQERSAPGGQYSPAPDDGSRPAIYLINAYEPTRQSRAGVESTAFHEAYPGHHLQIAIAKEHARGHRLARYFRISGFSEGWGLYAERLADEMGLFSSDVDRLGMLSNEALRAARLVVDSGMHALGWSRQEAIDYVLAHTTESPGHAASEIDRYIAVPGQATAYMLGALEIRRLREEAERALGPRFDVREFHDRVLEDGGVTLGYLRHKIERWIAAER